MSMRPFFPTGATLPVAASATSAGGVLPGDVGAEVVRVLNDTDAIAFVRWGEGAQTAVLTDTPVPPRSVEAFGIPLNTTQVAVILSTGTGNVYFTRGQGF